MIFRIAEGLADFSNVLTLYNSSFPENERRLYTGAPDFMEFAGTHNDRFHILLAETEDGNFQGFITYWSFDDFVYVEHFAVVRSLRGGGTGTALLSYLAEICNKSILLEVESPVDDITCRRVRFYEKNGFRIFDGFRYIQPPYSPDQCGLELKLMLKGPYSPSEPSDLAEFLRVVYNA